ncbi:MAG: hypothetical protein KatS3mg110_3146 [Pirellulaceae bacterium]|nr:MAG: hypothetical protein KatS3mg110_3146 [Pirellulaceae bacterium]
MRATRNGQPLPQRRVWHTWTVPGMFETLERDLEQMERSRRNEPGSISLVVYVAFDPTYGYPARYLRSEASAAGANPDVTWEVIEFELLDGSTR